MTQLTWSRYSKMTEARKDFASTPCIYVQTDPDGQPLRVGMASKGLEARYRGGTGYALDAAMHASGNLFFVSSVPAQDCEHVERQLIWQYRERLIYNNVGKRSPPEETSELVHKGDAPNF